jgi:hypothetical protein
MGKVLVDLIDVSDMGVNHGGDRRSVEEYVKLVRGDDFEIGLEVPGGYEVVDSTGVVVAYLFLVSEDDRGNDY